MPRGIPFKKGNKFAPGGRRPGAGRKKGTPNKISTTMRQAYTLFIERNIPKFQKWMDTVAKTNPAEALNIAARFSEFCLPKLMRAEVTGEDGAPLAPPVLAITFVNGGPGYGGLQPTFEDHEPAAIPAPGQGAAEPEAS